MTRLLTFILLLYITPAVYSQEIKRYEADSLLKLLSKSKPDTSRINLLLQLAKFQIFKPREFKQDLDSASVYIEKAKALNATLKSEKSHQIITLIEAYLIKERGQTVLSKKMVEQVIEMINKGEDKSYLADAYFELSDYYDYADRKQLIEKIKLVELAVSGFQQTSNKERQAYSLKVLADLYIQQGEYSRALQKLNLSLEVYNSIHYTQLQAVYALYGSVYYELANYKQALYYELQALKIAENTNDTSMNLCQLNNSIGVILLRLGEKERAIDYLKTALQIAVKYNDDRNVLLLLLNITDSYIKLKKPGEGIKVMNSIPNKFLKPGIDGNYYTIPTIYLNIYYNLKNYNKAQVYANQLLDVIKANKPEDRILHNIYNLLIGYYISSGQLKAADIYLKKSDFLSRKIADPNRINRTNYLNFRLDTAQGNFKSAVYDLLTYNNIADSIFSETKSKQIKQLEIEYETGKKEDSIKLKNKDILVLNQQYQLQKTNFEKANLLKNITVGGILLLLVIVILLFRQYRQKKQTNLVISSKNEILENLLNEKERLLTEKEWLLKEVHHRVKNNLQIVISLLNTQSNYLESEAAVKAIRESQERMNAISLIHQKLYKSEDTAFINIREYVHELVEHIRNGFSGSSAIVFELNISDAQMDVAQAVPVGLILNEAISNAIKYAFPGNSSGLISISITHSDPNDAYLLTIADNGVGLPPDYDISKKSSLGMRLMQGLTKQLGGSFNIESNNGVQIKVAFRNSNLIKIMQLQTND